MQYIPSFSPCSYLWAILSFLNFASHQVLQTFLLCGQWIKLGVLCSFQGERLPHSLWKSGSLCQGLVFPCCALVSEFPVKVLLFIYFHQTPKCFPIGGFVCMWPLKIQNTPPHSTLLSFAVLLTLPNMQVAVISTYLIYFVLFWMPSLLKCKVIWGRTSFDIVSWDLKIELV